MILTLLLTREAFAAKRRKDQDDGVEELRDLVAEAVTAERLTPELRAAMQTIYEKAYNEDIAGEAGRIPAADINRIRALLDRTDPDSNLTATTLAIVNMLINLAAVKAAHDDEDDLFLEWVTMHDGDVRQAHKDTDGQVRPAGEKFDVDGTKMSMPGDVTAPIELWINCRCTLRPTIPPNDSFLGHTVSTETSTSGLITMTTAPEKAPEGDLAPFEDMTDEQVSAMETLVPWHGVLAPEGVASGDGRTFAPNSLTNRDLPLPLTYQKSSAAGHDGSVVVGSIETIERVDGLMQASGYFLSTAEADEVIGLIAHFGKYGVSVDADDAEFDYEEDSNAVTFTKARICSASLVSIPAFAEAYVALGPFALDNGGGDAVAAGASFKDLAPGKTEDGPGWLTHPVDTDRLRDYWVRGPGAAKIGWGTPGDFNRCRLNLSKYVKPEYLAGYCANRHYDALGFWPGRPVSGDTIPFEGETAPALSLVASATERIEAPAAWFGDPGFTQATHLRVTKEGRVFGHVAEWGVCHIGIGGVCTEPPKSKVNYGYFANKRVPLDDGTYARTGVITLGGKHAPHRLGLAAATQHYDDTTKALADVSIGEDEFGIWVNGWVRPGADPEDAYTLSASDVSGDWRAIDRWSDDLELVAVLAVNAGGFPVKVAASNGRVQTLVAAGMIQSTESGEEKKSEADVMAEAIAKALERVEQSRVKRAATMASLREKYRSED